jgi:hypothetical protein
MLDTPRTRVGKFLKREAIATSLFESTGLIPTSGRALPASDAANNGTGISGQPR